MNDDIISIRGGADFMVKKAGGDEPKPLHEQVTDQITDKMAEEICNEIDKQIIEELRRIYKKEQEDAYDRAMHGL